ncbi:MAG: YceI family protein [Candidatus Dormibacteria bacterium]
MTTAPTPTVATTGTWAIDPSHSSVHFTVRHLVSKVRGNFGTVTGVLNAGTGHEDSSVEGEIEVGSINTNDANRDNHLRSADFFEVEKHPKATFKSTKIESKGGNNFQVTGNLTFKGVSKPATWDVEYLGEAKDAYGNVKQSFEATTTINREDWGLTWNAALETGGMLVGKDVKVEAEIQFAKQG